MRFSLRNPRSPAYERPISGQTTADLAEPEEWSCIECLRIVRYKRVTVAWITAAGLVVATIFSMVQPRWYQSSASLEVQGINENFLNLRDIYPTAAPSADLTGVYIQTQAEILQQNALMELVAKRLRLGKRPEFGGRPGSAEQSSASDRGDASPEIVEEVRSHFRIVPVRNSRIIEIVSDAPDAQLAADMANTLAEVFIAQRTEERRRDAQQTYESLRLPLEELKRSLERSEAKLEAYGAWDGVDVGQGLVRRADTSPSAEGEIHGSLKSEVDANRRLYQIMLQRVNDSAVASAVVQGNIRLVSKARAAASSYKPNLPLNLAIGLLGGLLLGIGWVLLKEQTNAVMRAPGEAGKYLPVPELGAIPRVTEREFGTSGILSIRHLAVREEDRASENGLSSLAECFRTTLASILSASGKSACPRTLVITSSLPTEGKTTVVSNLGVALAEISSRVLLIDGDMRRPRLHRVFGQTNSWGLSDVLREKNAVEDLPVEVLVKKTDVPHLYLLPSGSCTDNIFGLLYAGRLSRLIPRFRQEFEYVLIDAPPCLEFADARVMARYAEELLLVVRANWTARQTARAALQRLQMDGIPVMGVILNRCDPERSDLYGYAL